MKHVGKWFKNWYLAKIYHPFIEILKRGITPHKLALSISMGFVGGLIPVFGITTIFCVLLGFIFRLNHPTVQLTNYIISPLHLIMIIPFMKIGHAIFADDALKISIAQIKAMYQENVILAFKQLGIFYMEGILAWLVFAVPVTLIIYLILFGVFKKSDKFFDRFNVAVKT